MFNRYPVTGVLIVVSILSFLSLSSSTTSADVTSDVAVAVPVSCNMTSELDTAHTATINAGQYQSDIGTTNFKVVCNDNSGYAIYAIGYSNEEYGNTKMLATINNTLTPTYNINTGTNTSGANSSWSMKLIPVTTASSGTTQPYTPTIESDTNGSFANYHVVPETYTKVATFASSTDATIGSNLQSTYQVYIDGTKPAGTYTGKVKYTLVHPSDGAAPVALPAILDTGLAVSAKLKSLAATVANGAETSIDFNDADNYVKSFNIHLKTPVPTGFTPTTANTISSSTSAKPIYIVFDNTNNAGIMHFYTEGEQIVLPSYSSSMFNNFRVLENFSNISNWDTSKVTYMDKMFSSTGKNTTAFNLDLSSWDTSNVTDMRQMFEATGSNSSTFALDLSSWNTSNVTNMNNMFTFAGNNATTWSIDGLSSWNTSSITEMHQMFEAAGSNSSIFTLNLSSWDTSNVTDMDDMFFGAGSNSTTWSVTIPQTNGNNISNTTNRMYGQDTSVYSEPDDDKSFTIAQ